MANSNTSSLVVGFSFPWKMVEQRRLARCGRTAFAVVSCNNSSNAKTESAAVDHLFSRYYSFAGFVRTCLAKESTAAAAKITGQSTGFGFFLFHAGNRHKTNTV